MLSTAEGVRVLREGDIPALQELIDLSHWLGALITSARIIGTRGITPVRALIDQAAAMIPSRRLALCLVVRSGVGDLHAASFGSPVSTLLNVRLLRRSEK